MKQYIDHFGISVDKDLLSTKFTCDLQKCNGACCTMESEYGAPLDKEELDKIKNNLEATFEFLPPLSIENIKQNGFYEKKHGYYFTKSINNKDCVFVYYEGLVAKCSLEKAYLLGKSNFRKPISCHLFPIRISNFGGEVLKFEEYSECSPALELGNETGINVLEFCKEALNSKYGKDNPQNPIHLMEK